MTDFVEFMFLLAFDLLENLLIYFNLSIGITSIQLLQGLLTNNEKAESDTHNFLRVGYYIAQGKLLKDGSQALKS